MLDKTPMPERPPMLSVANLRKELMVLEKSIALTATRPASPERDIYLAIIRGRLVDVQANLRYRGVDADLPF